MEGPLLEPVKFALPALPLVRDRAPVVPDVSIGPLLPEHRNEPKSEVARLAWRRAPIVTIPGGGPVQAVEPGSTSGNKE